MVTWTTVALQAPPLAGLLLLSVIVQGGAAAPHPTGPSDATALLGRRAVERSSARRIGALETPDRPDEALERERAKRVAAGEREVPVERLLAAAERVRRMTRAGSSAAAPALGIGSWQSLGPGNVGGRTRALLVDPRDPRILFAAGVAGGVWRSLDGGGSWAPLTDLLPSLGVNTLAMDPRSPGIVYAGTGEGTMPTRAVRGAGVFRTMDGGATWGRLAATAGEEFWYVNDIVVSTLDSRRIYVATWRGVYRSLDAGATFAHILDAGTRDGCLDLALVVKKKDDLLLAACGNLEPSAVWRNVRAQASVPWEKVLAEPGMARTTLAVAPSSPWIVYAMASSYQGHPKYHNSLHAVFRSDSSGAAGSWQARVRGSDPTALDTWLLSYALLASAVTCGYGEQSFLVGQGWYANALAVDPRDPNRVWAGGVDLFRSDDGGRHWGIASYWWPADPTLLPNGSPVPRAYLHADQHALVFHPGYNGKSNRVLFVGNDGGVFRTDDARAAVAQGMRAACDPPLSAVAWKSLNANYAVTQFYDGTPAADGSLFVGGTQDNGTVLGSVATGPNGWRMVLGGDGGFVAVDPRDSQRIYAEYTHLTLSVSSDGGRTFASAVDDIEGFFGFVTPFLLDPHDPDRLWIAGDRVWRSDDRAATWQPASAQWSEWRTTLSLASAITVSPDAERVLVGTNKGFVHLHDAATTAHGTSDWTAARPRAAWVTSLAFDPADAQTAWATFSNYGGAHVWRSDDGGVTWSPRDGSGAGALPDLPVHSLAIDPANRQRLFVGTDLGIFASRDGGASWAVENTGFANVVTEKLVVARHADGLWLYAFTHGRGAWRLRLAAS